MSTSGIKVMLAGFELFPSVAKRLLAAQGVIAPGADGQMAVQERWIPLDSWLAVHEAVRKEIGANALFRFGNAILENPKFPAWIRDIDSALESIDIAYHRSHRKNGVLMYDQATGRMLEGIGHYRARRAAASQRIEVTCDTPYPCMVELGIVTKMASKFESKSRTEHGPGPCRDKNGSSCNYIVVW
ncbi:Hypothetical protein A7982_08504 [Minicystis rosea]|nr:Hypothetical protein A7982_08504 [Minicystis rosea]